MAEENKQIIGDGQDNYAQAAKSTADAAKALSNVASQAAAKGAEATANAAAASVHAGVTAGSAVSEVAAGTAAGGPWGAILAAVWALRHTLFKILIYMCLVLLFLITAVISLPSIVFNNIFHTDPDTVEYDGSSDIYEIADDLSDLIAASIEYGYDLALAKVEQIIEDNGYDYELSMEALINYGTATPDYDVCYILAAYSASMIQRGTTQADLKYKLNSVANQMFKVTYVERQTTRTVYDPETEEETIEIIKYAEATVHPFDQSVILTGFEIDLNATYDQFNVTYEQAISTMAEALRKTLFGNYGVGDIPPITDEELLALINGLNCSETRKAILRAALSLVGKVPYFWGGKSAPGWNDEWNQPKKVTSSGSVTTGTIRPYGLDCSGFTDWSYKTAGLGTIGTGSANQWSRSIEISEAELRPGDLGFRAKPSDPGTNHVLLFVGRTNDGKSLWVHCSSSAGGVVLNTSGYVKYFRRPSGMDLESNTITSSVPTGNPL